MPAGEFRARGGGRQAGGQGGAPVAEEADPAGALLTVVALAVVTRPEARAAISPAEQG